MTHHMGGSIWEEAQVSRTSSLVPCNDWPASPPRPGLPHPAPKQHGPAGGDPVQLTDLALLRLRDDDLPRLDGGCGAAGLLALLLPLDLDGGGLLSQREVVLDRLGRSHGLAHLLLWGRRRGR